MKRAIVFPGLGSQAVGMGALLAQNFAEARLAFEEVNEALQLDLTKMMFTGPREQLDLPENAQPALAAYGVAVTRVLEGQSGLKLSQIADFIAGHSLGEYTALCAAGSYTLTDMVRFLRLHGQIAQQAFPEPIGTMAVLRDFGRAEAEEICVQAAQGEVCVMANDNAPTQVVISGHRGAIERATKLAEERGCRILMLPVVAPYHSPLAQPIADRTSERLKAMPVSAPALPWIGNGIVDAVRNPELIEKLLTAQVTGAVRWRETMLYMQNQGVGHIIDCGPGRVLAGLAKKTGGQVKTTVLNAPEEIFAFVTSLVASTGDMFVETELAEKPACALNVCEETNHSSFHAQESA